MGLFGIYNPLFLGVSCKFRDDSDGGDDGSDTGGDNGWSSDNDPTAADPGSVSDSGKSGNDTYQAPDEYSDTSPYSQGPNGQSAPYGTYTGWDFDTYGWGDPSTGYQDTPDDAQSAYEQLAAQQQATAFQSMLDTWTTQGRDPEQEFQDQQDALNGGVNQTSYAQGASPAAISEYNSLGFEGALTGTPWSYTDLNGQTNTNYGSIGHDVASTLGSIGSVAGALTGYGELGMALSGISNAVLGNVGSVTGLLGSLFGGTMGSGVGSVLGSLLSGKDESAAKSGINTGLTSAGLSLGSVLNGLTDSKNSIANAATNFAGNYAQNAALSSALNSLGINNSGSMTNGLSGMLSSGGTTNNSSNNGAYYNE